MFGYIYMTTNIKNGKRYIGKKKSELFVPDYHGSGRYLTHALTKYGKENFVTVLLEECGSLEALNAAEKKYIQQYNAVESEEFYNISPGGDGGDVTSGWTDEQKEQFRKRMSKISKGRCAINKDGIQKYVNSTDLEEYLQSGWNKGGLPAPVEKKKYMKNRMQDTKYMTDGTHNVRVKLEDIEYIARLEQAGFVFGMSKTSKQLEAQEERKLATRQKKLKRQKEIEEYLASRPLCETCGEVITEFFGSGRFCSKRCSATHPHTEETKKRLRELNLSGVCGRNGTSMSEEEKRLHSEALKKYYSKNRFIWVTDGTRSVKISPDKEQEYIEKGFRRGLTRSTTQPAWNKGLTISDERVRTNIERRNTTMLDRYGTTDMTKVKNLKEE